MRRVVGKQTQDVDAAAFTVLSSAYRRRVLDVGTGDGKHVLALARSDPDTLAVGLDAGPDAMRRAAARAASKPARGGQPNAMFVWASVEHLPRELAGFGELHVLMPWGSLLRAMVEPREAVLGGLARACAPGASFLITLNLHAWRPPVVEVGTTPEPTPDTAQDALAAAYARSGWQLDDAYYLDDAAIAALGTSWTKRLGSTRDTLAVLALRGRIEPHAGN